MNTEHKSNTPKSIRDLWRTPKYVFDYYNKHYSFNLDLASSDENHLCEYYVTAEENGLSLDTVTSKMIQMDYYGTPCVSVWINPPYSDIRPWVEQAIQISTLYGCKVAMLLPADTSVKWFERAFQECSECHLISGRLAFINEASGKPVSGNNKGSVVFIFDPDSESHQKTKMIPRDSMRQQQEQEYV